MPRLETGIFGQEVSGDTLLKEAEAVNLGDLKWRAGFDSLTALWQEYWVRLRSRYYLNRMLAYSLATF